MSLQAWYPLNGHTNNYGVGDYPVTATNMAYSKEAMSGGDIVWDANHNLFNKLTKYATICFWIYINEATGAHSQNILIGDDDAGTSRQCAIFTWPTSNDLHIWSLGNNSGQIHNGAFPSYKWTHCALIFKDSTTIVYLNGVKVATLPYAGAAASQPTHVCRTGPTRLIRDLRFYDEALSPKMIKEISKGLILHIPCNQPDRAKNIMGTSGRIFNYGLNANGGSWSGSTVVDDGCECKKVTATSTDGGFWFDTNGGGWPVSDSYNGKVYTWSFEAKCSVNKTLSDVGHERGGITRVNFTTEWKQYKYTWTYKSGNANFVFYNGSWNSGEYILLRNLKIEEGANDNPVYTEGVLSTEYDCSGFGHNGTVTGESTLDQDSIRYNAATKFTQSQFVQLPSIQFSSFANSYTFSWYSKSSSDNCMPWGFGDGNHLNPFFYQGNIYWNTGDSLENPFSGLTNGAYNNGKWHHYVITGDGSTTKLYVDGIYIGSAKKYVPLTGTILYINGWGSWNGAGVYRGDWSISDLRVYSTALSAEDIKELYQQSASLTNNGILLSYDFQEEGAVS